MAAAHGGSSCATAEPIQPYRCYVAVWGHHALSDGANAIEPWPYIYGLCNISLVDRHYLAADWSGVAFAI